MSDATMKRAIGSLADPGLVHLPIERVEVFGVAVPLVGPGFKNAYITKTTQKSAIVRLVAVDGSVGLGNIDPSPGYSVETIEQSLAALRDRLAPIAKGLDAGNPHRLVAAMDAALEGHLDAKAAIDKIAYLRDVVGFGEIDFNLGFGGMPTEVVRRVMRTLAEQVMPHFK